MKILFNILYTVFVLVLVSVAGLFLISLVHVPGNIEMKIVKSGSMEPSVGTGSIVIIRPQTTYAVGDVITFGEDSRVRIPTTHRIFSIKEDGGQTLYTTKGDSNNEPDQDQITKSRIIGKVLLSIPYAGYILDFARQPLGFTLLIAIPAGVIILDESLRIIRELAIMRRRRSRRLDAQRL